MPLLEVQQKPLTLPTELKLLIMLKDHNNLKIDKSY